MQENQKAGEEKLVKFLIARIVQREKIGIVDWARMERKNLKDSISTGLIFQSSELGVALFVITSLN